MHLPQKGLRSLHERVTSAQAAARPLREANSLGDAACDRRARPFRTADRPALGPRAPCPRLTRGATTLFGRFGSLRPLSRRPFRVADGVRGRL